MHENHVRKCSTHINGETLFRSNTRPCSTRIIQERNIGFKLICSTSSTIPCTKRFLSFPFSIKYSEGQKNFLKNKWKHLQWLDPIGQKSHQQHITSAYKLFSPPLDIMKRSNHVKDYSWNFTSTVLSMLLCNIHKPMESLFFFFQSKLHRSKWLHKRHLHENIKKYWFL